MNDYQIFGLLVIAFTVGLALGFTLMAALAGERHEKMRQEIARLRADR